MEDFTIAIYCFVDDFLLHTTSNLPSRRKLSDAQVITTVIVSARFFSGNFHKARVYMKEVHEFNFPHKSNFNRAVHRLSQTISELFFAFAQILKHFDKTKEYIIDSFPVSVCKNIRIPKCKLLKSNKYRGYNSSKKEYFYGFKVQIITTVKGVPIDFYIGAGSYHDITAFKSMNLNLPENSTLYADSAYTDYELEDLYAETENIKISPTRKSNSKRKVHPAIEFLKNRTRKTIETTFSQITKEFPKKIHAVTTQGFLIKVVLFIIAYTFERI